MRTISKRDERSALRTLHNGRFSNPFWGIILVLTMELKLRRNNQLVTREEREDKALHNKTVLGRVGHDLNCICYDTTHAPFSENKDGELM